MELLLPMAAKKLELSFTIDPDVPNWLVNASSLVPILTRCPRVKADYARIRQGRSILAHK